MLVIPDKTKSILDGAIVPWNIGLHHIIAIGLFWQKNTICLEA